MGGAIASGCDKGVDCCCCLEQGENAFILVAALGTAALALDGVASLLRVLMQRRFGA